MNKQTSRVYRDWIEQDQAREKTYMRQNGNKPENRQYDPPLTRSDILVKERIQVYDSDVLG